LDVVEPDHFHVYVTTLGFVGTRVTAVCRTSVT